MEKNYAVIVSAGKGRRMGTSRKKQYLDLGGMPVLARTLLVFEQAPQIDKIIVVIPETDRDYCMDKIVSPLRMTTPFQLVDGGSERQDSVWNALTVILEETGPLNDAMVLVHDGVRPFVEPAMITDCIDKARSFGACAPGLKLVDTIKRADDQGRVEQTIDRESLYRIQTPQAFRLQVLFRAFEHAGNTGFRGTDDTSLVEHLGEPVFISKGSDRNIKITTPEDLILGQFFLRQQDAAD